MQKLHLPCDLFAMYPRSVSSQDLKKTTYLPLSRDQRCDSTRLVALRVWRLAGCRGPVAWSSLVSGLLASPALSSDTNVILRSIRIQVAHRPICLSHYFSSMKFLRPIGCACDSTVRVAAAAKSSRLQTTVLVEILERRK